MDLWKGWTGELMSSRRMRSDRADDNRGTRLSVKAQEHGDRGRRKGVRSKIIAPSADRTWGRYLNRPHAKSAPKDRYVERIKCCIRLQLRLRLVHGVLG